MASDDEEENLEALRLAVLASMKNAPKCIRNDDDEEDDDDDDDLNALRAAALKTTRKVTEFRPAVPQRTIYNDLAEDQNSEASQGHRSRGQFPGRSTWGFRQRPPRQSNLITIQTEPEEKSSSHSSPADNRSVNSDVVIRAQDKWNRSNTTSPSLSNSKTKGNDKFRRYESSGSENSSSDSSAESMSEDEVDVKECEDKSRNVIDTTINSNNAEVSFYASNVSGLDVDLPENDTRRFVFGESNVSVEDKDNSTISGTNNTPVSADSDKREFIINREDKCLGPLSDKRVCSERSVDGDSQCVGQAVDDPSDKSKDDCSANNVEFILPKDWDVMSDVDKLSYRLREKSKAGIVSPAKTPGHTDVIMLEPRHSKNDMQKIIDVNKTLKLDDIPLPVNPALKTGDTVTCAKPGHTSTGSRTGENSTGSKTGHTSTRSKTGDASTGTKTGRSGTGSKTGHSSTGSNTGHSRTGLKTGHSSTGSKTGHTSTVSKTGDNVTGSKTGDNVAGSKTGDYVTGSKSLAKENTVVKVEATVNTPANVTKLKTAAKINSVAEVDTHVKSVVMNSDAKSKETTAVNSCQKYIDRKPLKDSLIEDLNRNKQTLLVGKTSDSKSSKTRSHSKKKRDRSGDIKNNSLAETSRLSIRKSSPHKTCDSSHQTKQLKKKAQSRSSSESSDTGRHRKQLGDTAKVKVKHDSTRTKKRSASCDYSSSEIILLDKQRDKFRKSNDTSKHVTDAITVVTDGKKYRKQLQEKEKFSKSTAAHSDDKLSFKNDQNLVKNEKHSVKIKTDKSSLDHSTETKAQTRTTNSSLHQIVTSKSSENPKKNPKSNYKKGSKTKDALLKTRSEKHKTSSVKLTSKKSEWDSSSDSEPNVEKNSFSEESNSEEESATWRFKHTGKDGKENAAKIFERDKTDIEIARKKRTENTDKIHHSLPGSYRTNYNRGVEGYRRGDNRDHRQRSNDQKYRSSYYNQRRISPDKPETSHKISGRRNESQNAVKRQKDNRYSSDEDSDDSGRPNRSKQRKKNTDQSETKHKKHRNDRQEKSSPDYESRSRTRDDSRSYNQDNGRSHAQDDISYHNREDSRPRIRDNSRTHAEDDSRSHAEDDSRSHAEDDSRSRTRDDSNYRIRDDSNYRTRDDTNYRTRDLKRNKHHLPRSSESPKKPKLSSSLAFVKTDADDSAWKKTTIQERIGSNKAQVRDRYPTKEPPPPFHSEQFEPERNPEKDKELELKIQHIQERNAAILKRQKEIEEDRKLYG